MKNIIEKRFSPYSFTKRKISKEDIAKLFDAARQTASAFNEQPWRFVYAQKCNIDAFTNILSCLVPGNQKWAKSADLLILTFIKKDFDHNNAPNKNAAHDLGLAVGNLTTQASLLSLQVHNMAGIEVDRIKEIFRIPENYKIMTAIAVGYTDELKPNKPKKTIKEIAMEGKFEF